MIELDKIIKEGEFHFCSQLNIKDFDRFIDMCEMDAVDKVNFRLFAQHVALVAIRQALELAIEKIPNDEVNIGVADEIRAIKNQFST